MSQPHKVVEVLAELGYTINSKGLIEDADRQSFPYEGFILFFYGFPNVNISSAEQREQLMKGIRPDGSIMPENEKWRAILDTPKITSPALEHKRKQV